MARGDALTNITPPAGAEITRKASVLPDQVSAANAMLVINELSRRLAGAEELLGRKVDNDRVMAAIYHTGEDVSIQGDNVSIVGALTIADWVRDMNGETTADVDPAITRILGDKIQTGQIQSNNWGASAGTEIDLDSGTIRMGGSSSPDFHWNGSILTISGNGVFSGSLSAASGSFSGTITGSSVLADTTTTAFTGVVNGNSVITSMASELAGTSSSRYDACVVGYNKNTTNGVGLGNVGVAGVIISTNAVTGAGAIGVYGECKNGFAVHGYAKGGTGYGGLFYNDSGSDTALFADADGGTAMETDGAILPSVTATDDIGSASLRFANIYASWTATYGSVLYNNDSAGVGTGNEGITSTSDHSSLDQSTYFSGVTKNQGTGPYINFWISGKIVAYKDSTGTDYS